MAFRPTRDFNLHRPASCPLHGADSKRIREAFDRAHREMTFGRDGITPLRHSLEEILTPYGKDARAHLDTILLRLVEGSLLKNGIIADFAEKAVEMLIDMGANPNYMPREREGLLKYGLVSHSAIIFKFPLRGIEALIAGGAKEEGLETVAEKNNRPDVVEYLRGALKSKAPEHTPS